MKRIACVFVAFSLFFLLSCSTGSAQNAGTGAIAGVITDPSGSYIPHATIKLRNQNNGHTRTISSSSTGNYSAVFLEPATYTVVFSSAGFRDLRYDHVVITVTETEQLNVVLQIGSATEMVEVGVVAAPLKTETSSLGNVTGAYEVENLPLVTRNYTQIIGLSPGVSVEVTNAGSLGRGNGGVSATNGQMSISGASITDNSFQMNGGNINDFVQSAAFSGGYPIPNPDTIQEFKVQTAVYDASYGRAGGANVNLVTKGGTDFYHGSLFEFFRNTALNANDFFFNRNSQPRPVLRQNQFGFTIGGPIKKDKLTFFASYQGTRQANGISGSCSTSYLGPAFTNTNRTAAALGAMFAGVPTFYQSQHNAVPGTPGRGIGVAPDGSNISPQALALLNFKLPDGQFLIPNAQVIDPTQANPAVAGSTVLSKACLFSEDQYMANIDWNQSSKSRWEERFFLANSSSALTFNPTLLGGSPTPGFPTRNPQNFRNLTVSNVYVLTSKLVNQAEIGYNRLSAFLGQATPFAWSQVGVNIPSMDNQLLPVFSILGYAGVGGNGQNSLIAQNQYTLEDDISWVKGRHNLRIGGGVERDDYNSDDQVSVAGLIFGSWPDFLLGLPGGPAAGGGNDTGTVARTSPHSNVLLSLDHPGVTNRNWRTWDKNLYVQDDLRVTKRFTFNMGLRFERLGALGELNGRNANIDFAELNPNPPVAGTLQGYVVAGNFPGKAPAGVRVNGGSNLAIAGQGQNGLNPRAGFAWQLPGSDRFVLRGGYGRYHMKPNGQTLQQEQNAPPWSESRAFFSSSDNEISLAHPFPGGNIAFPTFNGLEFSPSSSQGGVGYVDSFHPPAIQHYGLNLQVLIGRDFALELGYLGSRISDLITGILPDQSGLASPSHPINSVTTNTADPANILARMPVQGLSQLNFGEFVNTGAARYNALEVSMRKQFSHGYQFLASYTWSRNLTTQPDAINGVNSGGNQLGDQFARHFGPDGFTRPHRLVVSGIYNLPMGQSWNRLLKNTVGGWKMSGVLTIQSGQRMTVTDVNVNNVFGMNGFNTGGTGGDYAQLSGTCGSGQYDNPGSVQSKLSNYINASCFTHNYPIVGDDGVGTGFGDAPQGLLHGPDENNIDVSIAKTFQVRRRDEKTGVEFRVEAFNLLNHPQFSNPDHDFTNSGSTFGQIFSTSVNPRILQLALKVNF